MGANLPLFWYPTEPGWKAPGTSQEAAATVDAQTLRSLVLEALRQHGAMTADACAAWLGRSVLSIRPRFSELRAMGRIVNTGRLGTNASGRMAIVWGLR